MKGQFVIIDLNTMDFFKDQEGKMLYYDNKDEAILIASIYELPNAWIVQLIHNHIENN
jgi:hypothetical protein